MNPACCHRRAPTYLRHFAASSNWTKYLFKPSKTGQKIYSTPVKLKCSSVVYQIYFHVSQGKLYQWFLVRVYNVLLKPVCWSTQFKLAETISLTANLGWDSVGMGDTSVLYQLEMAVADFGGFENSHRYWFLETLHWQRRERKEERLWLESLFLPSIKDNHTC